MNLANFGFIYDSYALLSGLNIIGLFSESSKSCENRAPFKKCIDRGFVAAKYFVPMVTIGIE